MGIEAAGRSEGREPIVLSLDAEGGDGEPGCAGICGGDGLIRCYNGAGQSHLDDCNKCADIRKALRGEEQGK